MANKKTEPVKKGWTWREWLFVAFIALNIGAKFCTIIVTTNTTSLGASASALEANSVNKIIQQLGYVQFLAQGVLYAVIITAFLHVRKRYGQDSTALNLVVLTLFILGIMDFTNDLAYVLAIIR